MHVTEFDRLKGYKLGAVDYVSIPVVPEILRSKVSVLVELHCQRRELQKLNRSLAEANAQLELANTTLQAEKTRELETLNQHLQNANAELAATNRALQAEIAERARAEAALLEADRHKDEFLAMLAHELRNPLAPIRNAVEIMSRLPLDDPQLDVVARRDRAPGDAPHAAGRRSARRLAHHARHDQARAGAGAQSTTIVARAVETRAAAHRRAPARADDRLPGGHRSRCEGDLTRLVQVLGNLLNNAAKYTEPRRTHRAVSARASTDPCEIRVRDNGIGIPPELLPRLFELFTQVDGAAHRAQGGLGIGLALVRQLVEMHAGEVAVRSGGPGQGSEFIVRLPLLRSVARCARPMLGASTAPTAGAPAHPARRRQSRCARKPRAAARMRRPRGAQGGQWRRSARAGGEMAAPSSCCSIIGMPMLDGYEVARRMRAQPWGKEMLIVALSGWGQSADIAALARGGLRLAPGETGQLRCSGSGPEPRVRRGVGARRARLAARDTRGIRRSAHDEPVDAIRRAERLHLCLAEAVPAGVVAHHQLTRWIIDSHSAASAAS